MKTSLGGVCIGANSCLLNQLLGLTISLCNCLTRSLTVRI